jgi:hypothetical protein
MYKIISSYQMYKYFENLFISEKSNNNLILEPLCVILRLCLLEYKPEKTKLSIKNNSIQYQLPSYDQGLIRLFEGDSRNDLHNLYHPILKAIDWYNPRDYESIYDGCLSGLEIINNSYENNSLIKHTISHYISVIQMNDNENYRKDTEFNPIIDSLKDIWNDSEIKSAIGLLDLIKKNKNRNIYIESLELILDQKEKFINEYINKISSQY